MSYIEMQNKEIKTIKGRTIVLNLSDADCERISKKTGGVGLSVSQLLESFIGDLVGGTYSNGSDERDMAEQWFNRCGFGMPPTKDFLSYLIQEGGLKWTLSNWDLLQFVKEDLEYIKTHKDEEDEEELHFLKDRLEEVQGDLQETFDGFKEWMQENKFGTLEQEMEKVVAWKIKLDEFKGEA